MHVFGNVFPIETETDLDKDLSSSGKSIVSQFQASNCIHMQHITNPVLRIVSTGN